VPYVDPHLKKWGSIDPLDPVAPRPLPMARYSLYMLKVPLNTKQTNKQRMLSGLPWWRFALSDSLVRFNGHFPGGPGLAGARMESLHSGFYWS